MAVETVLLDVYMLLILNVSSSAYLGPNTYPHCIEGPENSTQPLWNLPPLGKTDPLDITLHRQNSQNFDATCVFVWITDYDAHDKISRIDIISFYFNDVSSTYSLVARKYVRLQLQNDQSADWSMGAICYLDKRYSHHQLEQSGHPERDSWVLEITNDQTDAIQPCQLSQFEVWSQSRTSRSSSDRRDGTRAW